MTTLTKSLILLTIIPLALSLPGTTHALNARASTCTPTAGGSSSTDDVPAITSALASCGNGGTIVIPTGKTYYLNSVLDFSGCVGCDFQVEGLLKFTSDTDYWEGRTAMINVESVDGIKIRSLTGGGVIDGNGQDAYVLIFLYGDLFGAFTENVTGTIASLRIAATSVRRCCISPAVRISRSRICGRRTRPMSSIP